VTAPARQPRQPRRAASTDARAVQLARKLGLQVVEIETGVDYTRLVDKAGRAVLAREDEEAAADELVAKVAARVAGRRAAGRA
jgi:hypothetical protein